MGRSNDSSNREALLVSSHCPLACHATHCLLKAMLHLSSFNFSNTTLKKKCLFKLLLFTLEMKSRVITQFMAVESRSQTTNGS